jgi:NOL1/NOP2/fmu family ribosome biogenesis protein
VQEASSMFLEQALKQTADLSKQLRILDLSAAPGGKSTLIQSLISKDSLLVSNEVIRSRAAVLKENIIKWGGGNVMVTSNDPRDFARLENFFDVIVIDAPCSGSGLFRRDPAAIEEWSTANVDLCSQRQERILADSFPSLRQGGVLIYSTCSYSEKEDEEKVRWLEENFPLTYRPLEIPANWGISDTGKGYRFWPDKIKGEGFFLACLIKEGEYHSSQRKIKMELEFPSKKEKNILEKWLDGEPKFLVKNKNQVYAWPPGLADHFTRVFQMMTVLYAGEFLGELVREKLIPAHALAMSNSYSKQIPCVELEREDAIRYLRKKELLQEVSRPGWQLVCFRDRPLGWINAFGNRVNNYYPKEMRILKDN